MANETKKVLVIGCDFSPSSLPSSLRLRFLVTHLEEYGWEPTVLTTDTEYSMYPVDKENNNLLPKGLKVVRTKAIPVKITKNFGLNDIGMRSLWHYWKILSDYCQKGSVDLIIVSVPPHIPMILGRLAKKKYGIPYIIDYQDPWVSDYFMKLPRNKRSSKAYLVYGLSRLLEPFALKGVSGITGVSKGTIDAILDRYPSLSDTPTVEIPLGIEPEDFGYLTNNPRENKFYNRDDKLMHISYIGVYAPSMEQTVRSFFEAFKLGLKENEDLYSQIRLHFIGTSYYNTESSNYQIAPIAKELEITEFVYEHPERVPYLDAIQLMLDSHALIALGSEEPHYTASKIFPYILAKRPLLAIFHEESSVVSILNDTCSGKAVTFNSEEFPIMDLNKIKNTLTKIALLPRDYEPPTNWDRFQSYTASAMSGKLAEFLDHTINSQEV